ncbi:MAG: xanthine dehydrogenase accessory protein XdhC [Pseudomonadales bacterium]
MKPESTNDWVTAVNQLQQSGEAYVLITLLGSRGSTPRDSGTKMVVAASGSFGTIGGGHLEHKAMAIAARMLAGEDEQQRIEHFPLGPSLGQCCGGSTTVLFESFPANTFNIMLCGAGHVGQALAGILCQLPCRMTWIDSRDNQHPQQLASNVQAIVSDSVADEVAGMPAASDYLIMTHNHQVDFEILEAVLRRGDAHYVGLIGSATKWRRFQMRLEHKGYEPDFYQHVRCPVGLAAVPGKRPIEVAVSVAAEIIAKHHANKPQKEVQKGVSWRELKQVLDTVE